MPDGTGPDAFSTLDSAAVGGHPFPAQLLLWLSPAFPVGGFAFSHGLEWAAERGWVKDRVTLEAWLVDLVTLGSIANDLVLLAAAWRAATAGDDAALSEAISERLGELAKRVGDWRESAKLLVERADRAETSEIQSSLYLEAAKIFAGPLTDIDLATSGADERALEIGMNALYKEGVVLFGYRAYPAKDARVREASQFYTKAPVPMF